MACRRAMVSGTSANDFGGIALANAVIRTSLPNDFILAESITSRSSRDPTPRSANAALATSIAFSGAMSQPNWRDLAR